MGEPVSSEDMLQPGQLIRPVMTERTASYLVETLYGFKVKTIKEMNSYYDRNYKVNFIPGQNLALDAYERNVVQVHVEPEYDNPNIDSLWPHGYILKVLNSMDSYKNHIAAEHEVQGLLHKAGIACPQPILDCKGRDVSMQTLTQEKDGENVLEKDVPKSHHAVRMLTFIPGDIINNYDVMPDILIETGYYLALIHEALKDYSHPAVTSYQSVWSLIQLPRQSEFLYAVKEASRRELVEQIIDSFSTSVLDNVDKYTPNVIHGDYNEQNILVKQTKSDDPSSIRVCGVIDFGHIKQSYSMFDLAIAIMYMSVNCKQNTDPIKAGGYVLSGYLRKRSLNIDDWRALRVCVAGRYVQSLVMGAHSYMLDPGNEYLLVTSGAGWGQLNKLWRMPAEDLYRIWFDIIKENKASITLPDLSDIL